MGMGAVQRGRIMRGGIRPLPGSGLLSETRDQRPAGPRRAMMEQAPKAVVAASLPPLPAPKPRPTTITGTLTAAAYLIAAAQEEEREEEYE